MAKLFVSDIDGTLLNSKNEISNNTKKAFELLVNDGYDIALCSGRGLASVKANMKLLGRDGYAIGNNGAVISYGEDVIYSNPIPLDKLLKIYDVTVKRGYGFHMYDRDTYYSNYYDKKVLGHLFLDDPIRKQANGYFDEHIMEYIKKNNVDIYKFMLHMSFTDDMECYESISNIGGLYLSMSGYMSSDVMNFGVNKGNSIDVIRKNSRKDYDFIVAIGDHENDIPMIEKADFGIAMGNAIEPLKAASDYITQTNDNDGLYKAVKFLIEGKRK